jgi:hypothetical protein
MQGHCHTKLLATRYSLPFRLGRSLALPFLPHRLKSVATKTKPAKAGWEKLEGASPDAPNFSAVREHCPPDKIIRHSLPFSFC